MNIKAIALDLDGTLVKSKRSRFDKDEISPRTKEAVIAAGKSGIKIILCTGRVTKWLYGYPEILHLQELGGYAINFDGGQIIDFKSGEVIRRVGLPRGYYGEVLDLAKRFSLRPFAAVDDGEIPVRTRLSLLERLKGRVQITQKDLLKRGKEVMNFYINGDPKNIREALEVIAAQMSSRANCFIVDKEWLEISASGIDKGQSLRWLLERLNISPADCLAFGDSHNDIPMFNAVGHSVAMGNADDEVKKFAKEITKSNDEDGIAEYLIKNGIIDAAKINDK